MNKIYFLFLFSVLFQENFYAQIHLNALKNDVNGWENIISQKTGFNQDTAALKRHLKPLIISKTKEHHILYHALLANGYAETFDGLNKKSEFYFTQSVKEAEKSKNLTLLIWTQINYAKYLYKFREMTRALPLIMNAAAGIEQMEAGKILFPGKSFKTIGYYMGTIGDNEEAINYLKKARQTSIPNTSEYAEILDNIGLYYYDLQDIINAENYFNQASVMSEKIGDQIRYAKTLGNLALIEEAKGNYGSAIQLVKKDIEISEQYKADQNTMFGNTLLARFQLKDNNLKEAEAAIGKAEKTAASKPYFKTSELEILKLKLEIYSKQNRSGEELEARRRITVLEDSLKKTDGALPLSNANLMAQKTKYLQNIRKTEDELRRESSMKKLAVGLAGFLMFIAVLVYFKGKRKEKRRQVMYNKKIADHEKEKVKYERKLSEAHETLQAQVEYLRNKNNRIQQLNSEIEEIKNSTSSYIEDEKGKLHDLLQSHLMTEENWLMFRREFQKEYPEFYQTLKTEFPEITTANLRIILLQKMGFSSSEISGLLGITQDAVKKSRQRLKRKLGEKYDQLFTIVFSES
ncbi:MAG: tetratricopeptide repeat protein [Weeksellaceae bacterium]|nr:tetratricopeptide repeat protein [Bacteroidota bacterium]MCG2780547.1 tetratricopeptide repeat protein [Weeksellaceae bacterium]